MQRAYNSDMLLNRIRNYDNLKGIFTGHTHHYYHTMIDTIPYYTVGSCSFMIQQENHELKFYQKPEINYYEIDDEIYCQIISKDSLNKYIGIVKEK